jgi:hypothetical protein
VVSIMSAFLKLGTLDMLKKIMDKRAQALLAPLMFVPEYSP